MADVLQSLWENTASGFLLYRLFFTSCYCTSCLCKLHCVMFLGQKLCRELYFSAKNNIQLPDERIKQTLLKVAKWPGKINYA